MEKESHLTEGINLRLGISKEEKQEKTIRWLGYSTTCTISSKKEIESTLLKENQPTGKWEEPVIKQTIHLTTIGFTLYEEETSGYPQLKEHCKNGKPMTVRYELPESSNYYFQGQFTLISLEETTLFQEYTTYRIRLLNSGPVIYKAHPDKEQRSESKK